jgi:hypothetical protein
MENTSLKQPEISASAFREARLAGKTVKELASQFNISESNCKKILKTLDLPKRAPVVGYQLINDLPSTTSNQEETNNWSEQQS